MSEFVSLITLIAALCVGVVSPGPSFVMVSRIALSASRAHAIAAALGMGAGGALFAVAALLGLQAILTAVPTVYVVLKLAGGLYLCYLGVRVFLAARLAIPSYAGEDAANRGGRAFLLGLMTQVSNPKTAIVYASVFAALLPPRFSAAFAASVVAAVLVVEAGWYALVALVLSTPRPRSAYLAGKAWVDRVAGAVMVALGIRLLLSSGRP